MFLSNTYLLHLLVQKRTGLLKSMEQPVYFCIFKLYNKMQLTKAFYQNILYSLTYTPLLPATTYIFIIIS